MADPFGVSIAAQLDRLIFGLEDERTSEATRLHWAAATVRDLKSSGLLDERSAGGGTAAALPSVPSGSVDESDALGSDAPPPADDDVPLGEVARRLRHNARNAISMGETDFRLKNTDAIKIAGELELADTPPIPTSPEGERPDREALIERVAEALEDGREGILDVAPELSKSGRRWEKNRRRAEIAVDALVGAVPSGAKVAGGEGTACLLTDARSCPESGGSDSSDAAPSADRPAVFTTDEERRVDAQPEREDGEEGTAGRVHAVEALLALRECGIVPLDPDDWRSEWEAPSGDDGQQYPAATQALRATFALADRERDEAQADVERLAKALAAEKASNDRAYAALQRSYGAQGKELEALRASKPLSTDVLRNPPVELSELVEAEMRDAVSRGEDHLTQLREVALSTAADWIEHSPPSLSEQSDGERPGEVVFNGLRFDEDGFSITVAEERVQHVLLTAEERGQVAAMWASSPAVGLTVEEQRQCGEVLDYLLAAAQAENDGDEAAKRGLWLEAVDRAATVFPRVKEVLAAVSEGPDEGSGNER